MTFITRLSADNRYTWSMNKIEAAEKRYANLKYLWQQAEKEVGDLKVQNADLRAMLITVRDNIGDDPDIYWKNDLIEQIEQALAKAKAE